MMIEKIKRDTGSVYVVGDIHGCYDGLMQKLHNLSFDFENDLLISVGDLVDRGAQNVECITLIDEPWFKAVRGNHDQMCIDGETCIPSFDCHIQNGGGWLYDLIGIDQKFVIRKIESLPLAIEIEYGGKKYGIVHADIPYDDWNVFKEKLELFDALCSVEQQSIQNICIWSRNRASGNKGEQIIKNIDTVYCGHTVAPEPTLIGNVHFIDTGFVFFQNNLDKLTIIKL